METTFVVYLFNERSRYNLFNILKETLLYV